MKKSFLKAMALGVTLSFFVATSGFAAGGSIVTGNVSVYKGGELVSTLSGQNPVEDGALFICKGRCMVKSEGISLIGADGAKMAVGSEEDSFNLYLKEGRVDYTITNNSRNITFITPDGAYSVADAVFDAASQPAVKGSVFVNAQGKTEIAVTEGRLVFATADGMKTISAGNAIVLAVNTSAAGAAAVGTGTTTGAAAGGAAAATGATIAGISVTTLAVGAVATAAVVGVAIAASDDDDDDSTPAVQAATAKAPEKSSKPKQEIPLSPNK